MIGARAAFLAAGLALVAGCGSDTGQTEKAQIAGGVVRGVVTTLMPGKTKAAPVDTEAMARSALASNRGPLILATLEGQGLTTVLGLSGQNGAMRSYMTPNQQGLILRDGMLAGTRGLGHDLMSSELGAVTALVRGRRAGSADKLHRYLDGEGIERPLPLRCTVTLGANQAFEIAGTPHNGQQVKEACTGAGLRFDNNYVVNGAGDIVLSRQWIGPQLGHVTIQTLRP